jgi:hypothetical protein
VQIRTFGSGVLVGVNEVRACELPKSGDGRVDAIAPTSVDRDSACHLLANGGVVVSIALLDRLKTSDF